MKIAAAAILLCIAVRPGLGRSRESKKAPEVRLAPPLVAPAAVAEPAPPSAGSIYAMSSRLADPGRDVRAGQVGDIVTILVSDRASAIAKGATNTSRKSSVKASIPSLLGKTRAAGPLTQLASATGDQQLQGQGQTSRETTLTTTLSARVIDVRPNGTLLIEGMKDISVNSERQWILVRGLIRTSDLAGNAVRSDRIADLEVRVNGKGVVGDSVRRPALLYRILLGLLPF